MIEPSPIAELPWLGVPLQEALRQRRSHALLVQAAPGDGAVPFVLALAQGLLCEGGAPPCGECAGCHHVLARSHPDLYFLVPPALADSLNLAGPADASADDDGGSKKKPSKQIQVDTARQAIDWAGRTSSRGGLKVLLIHPGERLNQVSGSALLKTLEEPSAGVVMLLSTADASLLLPTVRSRCQVFMLPPVPGAEALAWLGERLKDDPAVLLAAASGRPLDALALAQGGVSARAWAGLPAAMAAGQAQALAGWSIAAAVDALQKLCHDTWALAAGAPPRYFAAPTLRTGVAMPALAAWARNLARVARHDEHPWNEGLLIEALVCEAQQTLAPAAPAAAPRERGVGTLVRP